jgi:hypothetical protein
MEGAISGLVLGAWLWGVLFLGAHHAMVAQRPPSSVGERLPGYDVFACPGVHSPEEGVGSVGGGDGGAGGCVGEVRSHTSTTRQPGAGLTEQQGHLRDH